MNYRFPFAQVMTSEKILLISYVLEDKNAFLELGGWDVDNRYKVLFKRFTKTNNVTIEARNGTAKIG